MTWYCWNHWFWITAFAVICALPKNSVSSYPVNPLDEIKEHNSKKLPLKYQKTPIEIHTKMITADDVLNENQRILIPSSNIIVNHQINLTNFDNQTIDHNLINISNSNSNSNKKSNKNNDSSLSNNDGVLNLFPIESVMNVDHEIMKNLNQTEESTSDAISLENENINFANLNNTETENFQLNETNASQTNIMQIKKSLKNSTELFPISSHELNDENYESTTLLNDEMNSYDDDSDRNVTKLYLVTTLIPIVTTTATTTTSNDNLNKESTEKISTRLENVTKMISDMKNKSLEQERFRKSKGLSSEYRDGSRSINFSTETKNLLTRSASSDERFFVDHHDDGNVSSEALQVQGSYLMDAGTISGICFAVFAVCCGVAMAATILYRRRFLNKPQALSEPDSSAYIDDSTIRDNSDEMYSLDNDSFLNSLEAMTIQNYWTDTVKHTKL